MKSTNINDVYERTKKRELEELKKRQERVESSNSITTSNSSVNNKSENLIKSNNDNTDQKYQTSSQQYTQMPNNSNQPKLINQKIEEENKGSQKFENQNERRPTNMFPSKTNNIQKEESNILNNLNNMSGASKVLGQITQKDIMYKANDNVDLNISGIMSNNKDATVAKVKLFPDGREINVTKDDVVKTKQFYDENKDLLPSKEDLASGAKNSYQIAQKTVNILKDKKEIDFNTISEIYSQTKEHLPSGQQILNAGKNTAQLIQRSGIIDNFIPEDFEFIPKPTSNTKSISGTTSTTNKPQQPQVINTQADKKPVVSVGFDPLSGGTISKPEKKQDSNSNMFQKIKKGIF